MWFLRLSSPLLIPIGITANRFFTLLGFYIAALTKQKGCVGKITIFMCWHKELYAGQSSLYLSILQSYPGGLFRISLVQSVYKKTSRGYDIRFENCIVFQ